MMTDGTAVAPMPCDECADSLRDDVALHYCEHRSVLLIAEAAPDGTKVFAAFGPMTVKQAYEIVTVGVADGVRRFENETRH